MSEQVFDWALVNQLVKPEHQYLNVEAPPLEAVRMAWPFKTEEEQIKIQKWMRQQNKRRKIELLKLEAALL